ncbi:MAG: hypothetical protein AB1489_22565 [Acidobacteriota bacterium]
METINYQSCHNDVEKFQLIDSVSGGRGLSCAIGESLNIGITASIAYFYYI